MVSSYAYYKLFIHSTVEHFSSFQALVIASTAATNTLTCILVNRWPISVGYIPRSGKDIEYAYNQFFSILNVP